MTDLDAIIRGLRSARTSVFGAAWAKKWQVLDLLDRIVIELESLRDKGDQSTARDRDSLILAVRDIVNDGKRPELHLAGYEAARIADAAIASGWRPAPRVITIASELDDLPDRTVVLGSDGVAHQAADNGAGLRFWGSEEEGYLFASSVALPAAVIHTPTPTNQETP